VLIAPIVCIPVVFMVYRTRSGDMRGGKAADFSGDIQQPIMVLINCAVIVWLAVVLLHIA